MSSREKQPVQLKCFICSKKHTDPQGFCSQQCKEAAQIRTWQVPIRNLPIVQRLPRVKVLP